MADLQSRIPQHLEVLGGGARLVSLVRGRTDQRDIHPTRGEQMTQQVVDVPFEAAVAVQGVHGARQDRDLRDGVHLPGGAPHQV